MNNKNTFKANTKCNSDYWSTFTPQETCDNTTFMLQDIFDELKYIEKQIMEIKEELKNNKCKCCEEECKDWSNDCKNLKDNSTLSNKYNSTDNINKPSDDTKVFTYNNINDFSTMIDELFGNNDELKDIGINFFN